MKKIGRYELLDEPEPEPESVIIGHTREITFAIKTFQNQFTKFTL